MNNLRGDSYCGLSLGVPCSEGPLGSCDQNQKECLGRLDLDFCDPIAGMTIDDVRKYEEEMQRDTNSRVLNGVDLDSVQSTPSS